MAICGQGVGATWADTAPEQGMTDEEWKTAGRRRLRLKVEQYRMCVSCRMKDEKGDFTVACVNNSSRTRVHLPGETAA